jgi:hypothetical protein
MKSKKISRRLRLCRDKKPNRRTAAGNTELKTLNPKQSEIINEKTKPICPHLGGKCYPDTSGLNKKKISK